jgi:hypothetical protein
MEARIFTWAKPPRKRPIRALANPTSLRDIPPWLIISPERMKNGIASREKEFTPLTSLCTIDIMGMCKNIAVKTEERNREKVIGNFIMSMKTNEPIRMNEARLVFISTPLP